MAENRFEFKVINPDEFWKAIESDVKGFMKTVQTKWRKVGRQLLRRITIRFLSGRPGLKRISGNAARAMQVKTFLKTNDVVQQWEARGSGASYLPVHEGTASGGPRIIRHPGTSNGFGRGISLPPHDISIPKRTDIFNTITKLGNRLRLKSINDAIKEFV